MPHLVAANANSNPMEEKVWIRQDRPITSHPPPVRRLPRSHLVTDKVRPGHVEVSANTHLLRVGPLPPVSTEYRPHAVEA